MTTLRDALRPFWVRPEASAAIALATDGIKPDAKVGMIAIKPIDGPDISVFVAGANLSETEQYHGIPATVYSSLAVEPHMAAETLQSIMETHGITCLVAHQAFTFVRDKLLDQKLLPTNATFVDPAVLHKTIRYWNDRLSESTSILHLQERVKSMRGLNRYKLDELAELYGVPPEGNESPYIPENKARVVRDLFLKQLDAELPV